MVFRGAWAAYNNALTAQPLLVKAATSFTGFTVGDILAQKFINPDDKYDFARTLRLGSFGALVHGPTGHFFYGMLDRKLPGTSPTTVATKVAIDQVVWNPIFGVMFFTYLGLTEGKTMAQISDKIKADLQTAVMGSWAVWIPAHTINFRFVPSSQRLLYINSIQIGYNVFLSFLGNKGTPAVEDKAHDAHAAAHDAKIDFQDSASQAKDDLREAKGVAKGQLQQAKDATNEAADPKRR